MRQGTPPPTMCTERLPSGGGKGGGGGGAAAAFILISFRRCPSLLALLASPSSSLRAHQGHDNMHSHAEEAQQVAWKTCFRDILPDVCIGKRLQPYAGANPVTWWEMLKSAVAGDAAADETEQANTAPCQLAKLAVSQFRFSTCWSKCMNQMEQNK